MSQKLLSRKPKGHLRFVRQRQPELPATCLARVQHLRPVYALVEFFVVKMQVFIIEMQFFAEVFIFQLRLFGKLLFFLFPRSYLLLPLFLSEGALLHHPLALAFSETQQGIVELLDINSRADEEVESVTARPVTLVS